MPEHRTVHAKTRAEWRTWLSRNHENADNILLISYKKHTGKPSITHREAMDEAICFGWIDTTIKRIDEDRYSRCFVKRKENASWSNATLSYAKELIRQERMTAAGLVAYRLGLKKPTIDNGLPKNPDTPDDLKKALSRSKKADEFFSNLSPSSRRYYIYWVEKAIRPETRKRRIKEVYTRARDGKKPRM